MRGTICREIRASPSRARKIPYHRTRVSGVVAGAGVHVMAAAAGLPATVATAVMVATAAAAATLFRIAA